jgi:hypothetical protein
MRTTAIALVLAAAAAACGASNAQVPESARNVAMIRTAKCGNCHEPPEPGSRTRAHLEDAFTRHKKRVHLSDDQWAAMVDYLARPEVATAQQTNLTRRRVPL